MSITVLPNEFYFDLHAASCIIDFMQSNPHSVIGLSTGRTTKNMYLRAAEFFQSDPFDIAGITFLGIDEVTNVSRDYAGSCYRMLRSQLLDSIGISDDQFLMPPTASEDFNHECHLFDNAISARGGIDMIVLGLGKNGHIGFNQPGTPLNSTTWVSRMDDELAERIRRETNAPPHIEQNGFTLGIKNIMHAQRIILVAKGADKADAVRQMLHADVSPDFPATVLQLHNNCDFLLDRDAAALLT
jgi:glucosamine-6-phosphate deaminase